MRVARGPERSDIVYGNSANFNILETKIVSLVFMRFTNVWYQIVRKSIGNKNP